jgi:hypothetical protein
MMTRVVTLVMTAVLMINDGGRHAADQGEARLRLLRVCVADQLHVPVHDDGRHLQMLMAVMNPQIGACGQNVSVTLMDLLMRMSLTYHSVGNGHGRRVSPEMDPALPLRPLDTVPLVLMSVVVLAVWL